MALSQIYTAVAGQVITAARWNNEFGNIYANGVDLAFPVTKAVSFAGFTVTLDAAGVTTLTSSPSQAVIISPGSKSGTPSANGSFFNMVAATYTDTNTSVSGTATLWAGTSFRPPTLAAANTVVTTTDAATVYIDGPPVAGTNETITEASALLVNGKIKLTGDLRLRGIDSRTNTVVEPFTVQMMTSGSPAAGIGTGIAFLAESADEAPCNIGGLDYVLADVTAGSEDSYLSSRARVAGAALVETYRWQQTGAFAAIFGHANTANRTYTLPDSDMTLGQGGIFSGPTSTGTGSTQAHEGSVTISANQALDGVHFYTNFTLDAAKTITLGTATHRLVIVATGTITINGTIQASGKGANATGGAGFSQPGGAGGRGGGGGAATDGGAVYAHSIVRKVGGINVNGASPGGAGVSLTGTSAMLLHPFDVYGGAAGSNGGDPGTGATVGAFGPGGGSVVLMAPNIVLGSVSVINTSGGAGGAGTSSGGGTGGGGGGGGAGNLYMYCLTYTDNGCTFTLTGGAAGSAGFDAAQAGGAGADGIKQINIYA